MPQFSVIFEYKPEVKRATDDDLLLKCAHLVAWTGDGASLHVDLVNTIAESEVLIGAGSTAGTRSEIMGMKFNSAKRQTSIISSLK
jgi:hypothetical protein